MVDMRITCAQRNGSRVSIGMSSLSIQCFGRRIEILRADAIPEGLTTCHELRSSRQNNISRLIDSLSLTEGSVHDCSGPAGLDLISVPPSIHAMQRNMFRIRDTLWVEWNNEMRLASCDLSI